MFITLIAAPINSDFELVSVVKMLPIRKVEIITCPKMFEVKPEVGKFVIELSLVFIGYFLLQKMETFIFCWMGSGSILPP